MYVCTGAAEYAITPGYHVPKAPVWDTPPDCSPMVRRGREYKIQNTKYQAEKK